MKASADITPDREDQEDRAEVPALSYLGIVQKGFSLWWQCEDDNAEVRLEEAFRMLLGAKDVSS